MTPEQSAAFVISQTAGMLAEIEAMKIENEVRRAQGLHLRWDADAFRDLPTAYGLNHPQVLSLFQR